MKKLALKTIRFVKWFLCRVDVEIVVPVLRWFVRMLEKKTGPVRSPVDYHAAWKTKALEDFSQWLSEMPDARTAAASASADSCDLFTLLSEFSALRQEIRFQNREQSKAIHSLDDVLSGMRDAAERFENKSKGLETLENNFRIACEKRTVLPFFEVRDALVRGHSAVKRVMGEKSFFRPLPKGMDGILEGYELAVRRVDKAFAALDVESVETVGKPFDPKAMKAIGMKQVLGVEPGTVVEEASGGFVRNEEILQTARVVVAE